MILALGITLASGGSLFAGVLVGWHLAQSAQRRRQRETPRAVVAPRRTVHDFQATHHRYERERDGHAAAHEAAHAIVARCCPSTTYVESVTVLPRMLDGASTAGLTVYARSTANLVAVQWDYLATNLAGLAGEAFLHRTANSRGAAADLQEARAAAVKILAMGAGVPPWPAPPPGPVLDVGAMFATRPEPAVCDVLNAGYRRARHLLTTHEHAFVTLAAVLLERGTLTLDELTPYLPPRSDP